MMVLWLAVVACSGGDPATAANGPMTPPITVTVTLDGAASAELTRLGEEVSVLFSVSDNPTDEGTHRDFEGKLGANGGSVSIPPLSTAPGKLGTPLNRWDVNVTSARKSGPNNLLSCAAEGDEGTPPAAMTIACTLIDAPAAPAMAAASCDGGDTLFKCPVAGGKELWVCGKDGPSPWLFYRFGKPDAPDLVFPAARDGSAAAFTWEEVTTAQAMGNLLRFQNADVTYEVVEMIGAGGPNGEANNFSGVYVKKGEQLLASVDCVGTVESNWDAIKAAAKR